MVKDKFQQYMLIGVGVMVAIGFSGVFTYGSIVNTGGPSNDGEREAPDATLPSENYRQGSFNLTVREQAYLAANEQVVFVNAFYENDSSVYSGLEELPGKFDNRVYVNVLDRSESTLGANYQIEMPGTLIVGDQPTRRTPYTLKTSSADQESIKQEVCGAMRDVTQFGAICYS